MGLSGATANLVLNCHKPSTLNQYQSVWKMFINYLVAQNFREDAVSDHSIFNFLTEKYSES